MSDLRPIVFELLAAFSYMQSKHLIPSEINIDSVIAAARDALTIDMAESAPVTVTYEINPKETISHPPEIVGPSWLAKPEPSILSIPTYKICANCGDCTNKIVHLKRRPPMLECQACGYTYKWPHRWG